MEPDGIDIVGGGHLIIAPPPPTPSVAAGGTGSYHFAPYKVSRHRAVDIADDDEGDDIVEPINQRQTESTPTTDPKEKEKDKKGKSFIAF